MSNHSKYYGKGKLVKLRDGSDRTIGTIQFADHKNDRYHVVWKRPGQTRGHISLHSRMALVTYKG